MRRERRRKDKGIMESNEKGRKCKHREKGGNKKGELWRERRKEERVIWEKEKKKGDRKEEGGKGRMGKSERMEKC